MSPSHDINFFHAIFYFIHLIYISFWWTLRSSAAAERKKSRKNHQGFHSVDNYYTAATTTIVNFHFPASPLISTNYYFSHTMEISEGQITCKLSSFFDENIISCMSTVLIEFSLDDANFYTPTLFAHRKLSYTLEIISIFAQLKLLNTFTLAFCSLLARHWNEIWCKVSQSVNDFSLDCCWFWDNVWIF